jgi:hypothetical protein
MFGCLKAIYIRNFQKPSQSDRILFSNLQYVFLQVLGGWERIGYRHSSDRRQRANASVQVRLDERHLESDVYLHCSRGGGAY